MKEAAAYAKGKGIGLAPYALIPHFIDEFAQAYPEEMQERLECGEVDLLAAGKVDTPIVSTPVGKNAVSIGFNTAANRSLRRSCSMDVDGAGEKCIRGFIDLPVEPYCASPQTKNRSE